MASRTQERLLDELLKEYKGPESFWGELGFVSICDVQFDIQRCRKLIDSV